MKVRVIYNPDADLVASIKQKLEDNGGYCPCRVKRTPSSRCMCEEFRGQLADPNWYGECHCGLYVKIKEA